MSSQRPLIAVLMCLFMLTYASSVCAQQTTMIVPDPDTQTPTGVPPLLANYSAFELTMTGLSVAAAGTLILGGDAIFGPPAPGMGTPSTESVDWRFSEWANDEPFDDFQWYKGVPDMAGYVMPAMVFAYYGAGALGNLFDPDFFMADNKHELIAFTESLAWTMITVNVLKLMVGRQRPYVVREGVRLGSEDAAEKEKNISFPSGHSAAAAMTSTFLFWDISDHLIHKTFASSNAAVRYGVGYGAPLLGALGATWTIMYSRIRDQRHWLSDTLIGASIGVGFSTLFYMMHFDGEGDPKRRHERTEQNSKPIISVSQQRLSPSMLSTSQGQQNLGLSYSFTFH